MTAVRRDDTFKVPQKPVRTVGNVYYLPSATTGGHDDPTGGARPSASSHFGEGTGQLNWLASLYSLVSCGQTDQAIDLLFRNVDKSCRTGDFSLVDSLVRSVDVKRLNIELLLALVAITKRPAEKLAHRGSLLVAVQREIKRIEPNRADRLLKRVR
jgi:hypothetical protein